MPPAATTSPADQAQTALEYREALLAKVDALDPAQALSALLRTLLETQADQAAQLGRLVDFAETAELGLSRLADFKMPAGLGSLLGIGK